MGIALHHDRLVASIGRSRVELRPITKQLNLLNGPFAGMAAVAGTLHDDDHPVDNGHLVGNILVGYADRPIAGQ